MTLVNGGGGGSPNEMKKRRGKIGLLHDIASQRLQQTVNNREDQLEII